MELNSIENILENSIESCYNFESYFDDQENISVSDMLKIFISSGDEKKEIIPVTMPASSNLFIVRDVTNDTTLLKHKKRGRYTNLKKKKKEHDKFSTDNIQRKIQVHFISFIIYFLNDILKSFGIREKFLKLNYEFKKDVNKQKFAEFKSKSIGEIVSSKISTRYKKEENANKNLCEHLKTNEIFRKIFDMNYMSFFRMYYMKNEKTIDLKIFGIEKEISLSKKAETYYEFIEKLKAKEKNEKYINQINECLNKKFLKEKKFVLY